MKIHVLLPLSVTALTLHLRCWDSLEHLHNFCTSIRKEYICFVHILNYLCLYLCLLPLIFLVWYILFSDEWGQKLYAYHVDVMSANPYLIKNKEILYQQQCAWCLFPQRKVLPHSFAMFFHRRDFQFVFTFFLEFSTAAYSGLLKKLFIRRFVVNLYVP